MTGSDENRVATVFRPRFPRATTPRMLCSCPVTFIPPPAIPALAGCLREMLSPFPGFQEIRQLHRHFGLKMRWFTLLPAVTSNDRRSAFPIPTEKQRSREAFGPVESRATGIPFHSASIGKLAACATFEVIATRSARARSGFRARIRSRGRCARNGRRAGRRRSRPSSRRRGCARLVCLD